MIIYYTSYISWIQIFTEIHSDKFFISLIILPIMCKSRLLFAKIAMAIWFQVSGVRKHVQFFIDLKILHVHIIAIGRLVFPLILKPDT